MKKLIILISLFSITSVFAQSPLEIDKMKMREEKQIKILNENPNDKDARFKLAQTYYDHGMLFTNTSRDIIFEKAFKQIDTLLQNDPTRAEVYYLQGLAYFNCVKNKKIDARTSFTKATELVPDYVDAMYWLARTKAVTLPEDKTKDMSTEAIEAYTKVIELDVNYKDAYFYRGYEYMIHQHNEEAVKDYSSYLALAPDEEEALEYRARTYRSMQDYCNAGADYKRLMDLFYNSRNHDSYYTYYLKCKDNCKEGIKEVEKPHSDLRQKYMGTYYVPKSNDMLLIQENDQVVQMEGMITKKSGYWSIADDGCLLIHNQDKTLVDHFKLSGGFLIKDKSATNNYGMDDKYQTAEQRNKDLKKNKNKDKKPNIFDIFKK